MDYIIASTVVTDEIRFADKKTVEKKAGGAGIYALCGIRLWCDSVMPVTGVGKDYAEMFGEWYKKNHISMDGLIQKDEKTPYNVIQYFEDGERSETALYGADHYRKIEVTWEELEPYFQTAKGIYIFKNTSPEFWNGILPMMESSFQTRSRAAAVMWEIASDSTCPECLEEVRRIAGNVDIFSINLTEARNLFGTESLDEIIGKFRGWMDSSTQAVQRDMESSPHAVGENVGGPTPFAGQNHLKLIFLRRGSKGAVMITQEETVYVPTVDHVNVVDPTGGGNSSSGAVLYGWCSGHTPEECGLMGSIAAAMCLEQYGVPDEIGMEKREAAQRLLETMKGKNPNEE